MIVMAGCDAHRGVSATHTRGAIANAISSAHETLHTSPAEGTRRSEVFRRIQPGSVQKATHEDDGGTIVRETLRKFTDRDH